MVDCVTVVLLLLLYQIDLTVDVGCITEVSLVFLLLRYEMIMDVRFKIMVDVIELAGRPNVVACTAQSFFLYHSQLADMFCSEVFFT